jgi:hypothetical protein
MSELDGKEMNEDADASPTDGTRPGIRKIARKLTGHLGQPLVAVLASS